MSLQNLLGVSLEAVTPSKQTIRRLLDGAARHIADAKVKKVSAETRFTSAYTAIRMLADVGLHAHGLSHTDEQARTSSNSDSNTDFDVGLESTADRSTRRSSKATQPDRIYWRYDSRRVAYGMLVAGLEDGLLI
jgi:hypothetical protein